MDKMCENEKDKAKPKYKEMYEMDLSDHGGHRGCENRRDETKRVFFLDLAPRSSCPTLQSVSDQPWLN